MKKGDVVTLACRTDDDGDIRVRKSEGFNLSRYPNRIEATLTYLDPDDNWLVHPHSKVWDGWVADEGRTHMGCEIGKSYMWVASSAFLQHGAVYRNSPPLNCVRCTTPNEYAVSNLPGNRFVCYSCKPIYKE